MLLEEAGQGHRRGDALAGTDGVLWMAVQLTEEQKAHAAKVQFLLRQIKTSANVFPDRDTPEPSGQAASRRAGTDRPQVSAREQCLCKQACKQTASAGKKSWSTPSMLLQCSRPGRHVGGSRLTLACVSVCVQELERSGEDKDEKVQALIKDNFYFKQVNRRLSLLPPCFERPGVTVLQVLTFTRSKHSAECEKSFCMSP